MTLKEQIANDIKNTPIILYMKGTKERPMCGFSAKVVNVLNSHSVVFQDVNILEDPEIRLRLSEYSNASHNKTVRYYYLREFYLLKRYLSFQVLNQSVNLDTINNQRIF